MSASAGRVLIIPKGTYNPNTPYVLLDAVFFNGNSYIAKGDTLGNPPTDSDHWQILAQGAGVISGAFAGSCDSLGSAQVKTVIIPPADNFALQKGVIVGVRFTNTNTFEATAENSIALNVNSTGALPIYFGGTATPLGSNIVAFGEADYTHYYQYDGTNWVFVGRSGVQTAEQTPYDSTKSTKAVIDELADKLITTSETVTGNPLTLTTDSAQVAQNTVITLEPIQSGSGDPSPSNVRAISGYDEVRIRTSKKNLFNAYGTGEGYIANKILIEGGTTSDVTDWNVSEYLPINPNTLYTLSGLTGGNYPSICFYDSKKNYISSVVYSNRTSFSFTTPNNAFYFRASVQNADKNTLQIELGDTATAYEPYTLLTDISEPFPSTVYGGTLDVESGELVVDKELYSTTWGECLSRTSLGSNTRGIFRYSLTRKSKNYYASICNVAPLDSSSGTYSRDTVHFYTQNDGTHEDAYIYLPNNTSDSTVIQIVVPLLNPITYHLTPHQVRLLEGANVVTSNGTSLSLTYRNGEVATLEDLDGIGKSINGLADVVDHVHDVETVLDNAKLRIFKSGNLRWMYLEACDTNASGYLVLNGSNVVIDEADRPPVGVNGMILCIGSSTIDTGWLYLNNLNGNLIARKFTPNTGTSGVLASASVTGQLFWHV